MASAINNDNQELSPEVKRELQDLQKSLQEVSHTLEYEIRSARGKGGASATNNSTDCFKAAALGGFFSIVQDVATRNEPSNIWSNAMKAAKASEDTHKTERAFSSNDVTIEYLTGKIGASRIGFVILGFMSAKESNVAQIWADWAESLDMILYRVCWPTGTIDDWDQFFKKTTSSGPQWFAQLTSNPWHVAQDKTEQVGRVLARFLERQKNTSRRKTVLIGHSLGAAIVYQALLRANEEGIVDHALALAGAFLPRKCDMMKLIKRVNGMFINAYSKNDQVLQTAFRAANFNVAPAAGNIPIVRTHAITEENVKKKIFDVDMTEFVPVDETTIFGHTYSTEALLVLITKVKELII